MQEETRDVLVSVTLFAAVFGMVYVFLMTRHRERMAMLERNLMTSPFSSSNSNNLTLKSGMLLVGLAIGFLILFVLDQFGVQNDLISIAMVCLFGGVSLIASYLIVQRKNNNNHR